MMSDQVHMLASSKVFLLTLTLGIYLLAIYLFRRIRFPLLHPLITSTAALIKLISLFDIDYRTYAQGTEMISFMLGPSVVALGYALYVHVEHLKVHAVSIITSVFVGSVTGILSVVCILRLFGAEHVIEASLMSKSVTTPIALSITERLGGIGSLTAVAVIVAGIFGSIIGPPILNRMGVTSAVARGLALGSASHGVGTARAFELGAVEGAISGLAIGLMGLITALLAPVIEMLLQ